MNLQKLIEYDHWANEKIFRILKTLDNESITSEVNKLFAHLLAAQSIWMERIHGKETSLKIWPKMSVKNMEQLLEENGKKLPALIPMKQNLIQYKNSNGEVFENSVEEILIHLTVHGQHHRAQIAQLLRAQDITPPATDFIFFARVLDN